MSDRIEKARTRRALGHYPWTLLDALEAELAILQVRAKREKLIGQILAVPSPRLRARLLKQLEAREAALVPDENLRRRLLGDRRAPQPKETDRDHDDP